MSLSAGSCRNMTAREYSQQKPPIRGNFCPSGHAAHLRKIGCYFLNRNNPVMTHLEDNRMTYWQHFKFAAGHACRCLSASLRLFIHACIPEVFQTAGRKLVCRMKRDFTCED